MATRSLILLVCGVVLTLGLQNVDYVQDNYMSTPEDQGSCGGCYGFALVRFKKEICCKCSITAITGLGQDNIIFQIHEHKVFHSFEI